MKLIDYVSQHINEVVFLKRKMPIGGMRREVDILRDIQKLYASGKTKKWGLDRVGKYCRCGRTRLRKIIRRGWVGVGRRRGYSGRHISPPKRKIGHNFTLRKIKNRYQIVKKSD